MGQEKHYREHRNIYESIVCQRFKKSENQLSKSSDKVSPADRDFEVLPDRPIGDQEYHIM